jgi:oxygen-independent coproporphyrinogen-3 oxidase
LGAQSLNSDVLAYLGRKHSREDVLRNIDQALSAGISNVQVDLIFGVKKLPSERDLASEVRELGRRGSTGVSCYLLTLEGETAFANEESPADDSVVQEYHSLISACEEMGFTQFETSNFSKSPAIHNRLYWYGLPYLGLGTGAHGLMPACESFPLGRRYQVGQLSPRDLPGDDRLSFATENERLFAIQWAEEKRECTDAQKEMIFTLLRTREGIPLRWLEILHSRHTLDAFWEDPRVQRSLNEGALLRTGTHLKLPSHEKIRGDSWALLLISLLHR